MKKPHAGKLLYERRKWMEWESFKTEVNPFLDKHF
jgi:hypothetical protein